jgi:hypothetical protein
VAEAPQVDREETTLNLCCVVVKVIINWESEQLTFYWKHGGISSAKAAMKPLREAMFRSLAIPGTGHLPSGVKKWRP